MHQDTMNTEDWLENACRMKLPCSTRLLHHPHPLHRLSKDGTVGVDLFQVASYGSALSCLRSKFICAKGPLVPI